MTNKKFTILLSINLLLTCWVFAQGGMWPVNDLQAREANMQSVGLQIPASAIYNPDKPALNDAVVLFGGGCTGEFVSREGLVFTNHHCGYGYGQSLSTDKQNILIDGFWAKDKSEEIPCPGLQVSIVKKTIDVTHIIIGDIKPGVSEEDRKKIIQQNIENYEKASLKISKEEAKIKAYFDGNQYYAIVMETYTDVRMVGFPPNGIGKFGGDTDNWMWPRHTGDFAVFRVYANKENNPAKYSKENVPYKPKKFFSISTKGVQENDFSMVYGFPYRTTQFITSFQTELIQEIIDPIRINARSAKLAVWDQMMRNNSDVFLKYASKQSSISNGWKKWQGEVRGLELNNVIGKKQDMESRFQRIVDDRYPEYNTLLSQIQALVRANESVVAASEMIRETVLGIEIVSNAYYWDRAMQILRTDTLSEGEKNVAIKKIEDALTGFYKNYDVNTDMVTFDTLMPLYYKAKGYQAVPYSMDKLFTNNAANFKIWRDVVFSQSSLASLDKAKVLLSQGSGIDTNMILNDPAYQIYHIVTTYRNKEINPKLDKYNSKLDELNRKYTAAQMQTNVQERQLYPDANQTLRLTYGPVKGIQPYGTNTYSYLTTLDEVISKTDVTVEEFNTPASLIDLYKKKDYGRWTSNGTVPVCFVAQNHTSGGNSGSPVLNAKGELIGINFDRIWDGTMSDIYYDPKLCRNISVDIRYVMFIIEKFGKASWLFKEMDIK